MTVRTRSSDLSDRCSPLALDERLAALDAPQMWSLTGIADGSATSVRASQFSYYGLLAAEHGHSRAEIAAAVALVTAKYLGDEERRFEAESGADARTLAEVCEAYVYMNFEEAEGNEYTDAWNGPHVITSTVHAMGLVDDYMRMKRGEQAMAFDDSEN